jgi:hypothetical protein
MVMQLEQRAADFQPSLDRRHFMEYKPVKGIALDIPQSPCLVKLSVSWRAARA